MAIVAPVPVQHMETGITVSWVCTIKHLLVSAPFLHVLSKIS